MTGAGNGRVRRRATRTITLAGASIVVIGSLAGCGGDSDDSSAEPSLDAASATVAASADASNGELLAEGGDTQIAATEPAGVPGVEQAADVDFGSIGRDVIVEMHVSMHSDDIARTVSSISAQAAALGGGIASSDIDYGTRREPSMESADEPPPVGGGYAVLVVKVPPASVNNLLDGLADSGTVVAVNQSATDVTDQLVDLDVRIANARASVENVRGFMAQTTNLGELVSLESELTRRQTELEQLEAQQRNLTDRVSLSTLTIEVRPTPAAAAESEVVAEPEEGIGDAFATGWDAFVGVLFAVAFIVAVLAPFLAVALAVLLIAWMIGRRSRTARSAVPVPAPPVQAPEAPTDSTVDDSVSID
jgi:hypothetical protein